MSTEIKGFRACELFTFDEWKQMVNIVRNSRIDGKPAAPDMAEQVIKPVIERIEAKVGGEIEPMYLAYAVEFAITQFLDNPGTAMVGVSGIPAKGFPQGPVN